MWLIGKDSDAGRDWRQEEKGTAEDEMAGWHHWLNGRESEWTPGVGDGQGGLACCDSWGHEESDMTEQLNWTELNWMLGLNIRRIVHSLSLIKYLLHICYELGIIPGSDKEVRQSDKAPAFVTAQPEKEDRHWVSDYDDEYHKREFWVLQKCNDVTQYGCESLSVVPNSLRPHGLYSPWNSPGQNTGVGSLSLLQRIFST